MGNYGRSTSGREYVRLANKHRNMALMIQKGRTSMYEETKVLQMEMWGKE